MYLLSYMAFPWDYPGACSTSSSTLLWRVATAAFTFHFAPFANSFHIFFVLFVFGFLASNWIFQLSFLTFSSSYQIIIPFNLLRSTYQMKMLFLVGKKSSFVKKRRPNFLKYLHMGVWFIADFIIHRRPDLQLFLYSMTFLKMIQFVALVVVFLKYLQRSATHKLFLTPNSQST